MIKQIMQLYKFCNVFSQKLRKDAVSAYAGQMAFFIILSFFPFVMFLLTLMRYTSLTEEMLLNTIIQFTPSNFVPYVTSWINEIYGLSASAALSITAVTCLWLASKGFVTMIYAFDSIYDRTETRNYIALRLFAVLCTVVFALILLTTLVLLVFGTSIYAKIHPHLPWIGELLLSIISVRSLIIACLLILFFLLLYKMIPNRKTTFLDEFPGAAMSTVGWMGFSYLYSYYINNISSYASIYGAMTTVAFLMLWLYICMYILLLGAEINVVFQRLPRIASKKKDKDDTP